MTNNQICKPNPVEGSHLSGTLVTQGL